MDLNQIRQLAEADMLAVNHIIQQQLHSDVALINQLGFYIVNSGGKRIRPLLTVLTGQALDIGNKGHHTLAAIIEFIHTATLLHDDVVDDSKLRRGKETANALFGNEASVLVGDFLYTRAFQMMVSLNSMTVMQVLADATNVIAEGEVMQLMNCNDPDTTEARYFAVIYSKTAKLFEAATRLAAVLAGASQAQIDAMTAYGRHLGTAFQLVDDVLDYHASSEEMGKACGDDLAEGKPTLPLIHLLARAEPALAEKIRCLIEQGGGREELDTLVAAMEAAGSLEYTLAKAREEADKAIAALTVIPASPYKDALTALARLAAERRS